MKELSKSLSIKDTPCFEKLYPKQLDQLTEKKKQLQYIRGEDIFKQGAFAPYIIFVIDGLVRVYLQTGYEKQVNLRLAGRGDFLAFESIFADNVYNYSASALKDSVICMVDKEALKGLLIENPEFAMQITSRNMQNEINLIEIVKTLSYKQMRGKLASAILYLTQDKFIKEEVFQYLTRQDIADFAYISQESTIKFLKEFEKENVLQLEGKNINVLDKETVLEISRIG